MRYKTDGSLDTSFDGDGIVTTDLGSSSDTGVYVVVQPDGKILLDGRSSSKFALVRYNTDGSLDTSFDGDGIVIGNTSSAGWGLALQPDGKILKSGSISSHFAVVRYNTDGSLDTSFNGSAMGPVGSAWASAVQNDGSIVVVGGTSNSSNSDFAVARYVGGNVPDALDDYADEVTDVTAPIGFLTIGNAVTGTIGAADTNDTYGDKDVFKVLLNQGQSYGIHLQGILVNGQSLPQGIFTIRDGANFSTILDTSGIGADVTETFTARTTGYHSIRVGTGGAATDQGGYQLTVSNLSGWSITSANNRVAEDSGSVSFTITRPSSVGSQTVRVSTTQSEGFEGRYDYEHEIYLALVFPDGVQSMPVSVSLKPDTAYELDETFGLIVQEFANPNHEIYLAKQTFTIINDDKAGWTISPTSARVAEDSGTLNFTITRPADGPTQTVYIGLPSGRSNDNDFTPSTSKVTFAAGETVNSTLSLRIINDNVDELPESFSISVLQSAGDDWASRLTGTGFTILADPADTVPGLDPGTLPASSIFRDPTIGSELNFLAKMAEAAYRLRDDEPEGTGLNPLNDFEHSGSAKDEFDTVNEYLDLLTTADLPNLGLANVGGNFQYTGLDNGIYTNQNAAALVGRSEDALFISFRGSNDIPGGALGVLNFLAVLGGGGTPDRDHWFDNPVLNDEGMAEHYALFDPLVAALDSYINNPANGINKIYVTGHSLGAGMVQAYMDAHSDQDRFEAVTFADPGYEGFDGLAHNFTDPRIITFRIENDPILAGDWVNVRGGDSYFISRVGWNFEPVDTLASKYHDMGAYLAISDYLTREGFSNFPRDADYDERVIQLKLGQTSGGNWVASSPGGTLLGSGFADYLWSTYGKDLIFGGDGGDYIHSGDGADIAYGESGNDAMTAGVGGGNDYYDGGADIDTIIYTSTSRGVTVNLSLPQDQGIGPEIDVDQIFNFENVVGGAGSDIVVGNDVANVISGNAGNDTLTGGLGDDILSGGPDMDHAVYAGAKSAYSIVKVGATYTVTDTNIGDGNEGTDTLTNIEWLQFADGLRRLGMPVNDHNGDGKADLLVQNSSGSLFAWQMNGNAIASSDFVAGLGTDWKIVGREDLDGDGKSDLLVQNSGGALFAWQMNGSAIASSDFVAGLGTDWKLAGTGDLDGDGKGDLLVQSSGGALFAWLMNGSAIASSGYVASLGTDWKLAGTGDLNGDGKTDLLVQNSGGALFAWQMNGNLITSSDFVAGLGTDWKLAGTGDLNGDGKADLLVQNSGGALFAWQMNDNTIASSGYVASLGSDWKAVDTGDFWSATGSRLIDTGDYNGDGKTDLLVQNGAGAIFEWQMDGTTLTSSNFVAGLGTDWSVQPASSARPAADDFNGDGKSDLLIQNSSGALFEWQMNGNTITSSNFVAGLGTDWKVVGTGDFNGDAKSDILVQDTVSGALFEWQMNGSSIASSGYVAGLGADWKVVGTGDFNGDAKSDILVQDTVSGALFEWQMNGSSIASSGFVAGLGTTWKVVGTGDFNGDTKSDILVQDTVSGALFDFQMNGSSIASVDYVAGLGTDWKVVGTGDFNGDTKTDILVQDTVGGALFDFQMNGSSIASVGFVAGLGAAWKVTGTGDYNGDGKSDILVQDTVGGALFEWQMNGSTIAGSGFVAGLGAGWSVVG